MQPKAEVGKYFRANQKISRSHDEKQQCLKRKFTSKPKFIVPTTDQ